MATERHVIKTYLNDEEKTRIDQLAHQLRLSRSELLKRLLMNTKLPSASDFAAWQGIRDLLKVNADMARLGNLFKLALDEPLSADLLKKFDRLNRDIEATQTELKAAIGEIRMQLQPGKNLQGKS
ncbi:Ribbon-helix-helix protein, copG family [Thalassospira xiamenensis M-5 = DSM 17429]|uniref:TraJ protein n=1 Tax=Thalassospira xiamenensis M-5 = DSM 17429 TaxID=1123366 RepID=A0AB72U7Z3_9PROT|nr:ribbon-helix-helix protein, CopG family [Thalassospira xiamenensis]AJD50297.1 TraJ protein [Thalassospira xiamenensis M-5 = DSM 17429]SIS81775.1 Ribbon-helix-helix protein, copG family [Thalassospira xiamenensis M-5 = DSM 17429]